MNRCCLGWILLLSLCLAACSGPQSRIGRGGDGPPPVVLTPEQVADAVPRPDPILRAGNSSPYEVMGVRYTVLPTAAGYRAEGIASWYGRKFHGRKTANGETFDLYRATAAHRRLPIPSYVRVTNLLNGRSVVVRVNDRGPFHPDRLIDLSYAAAVKLDMADRGTAPVRVEAVDLAGVDDHRAAGGDGYRFLQLGAFSSVETATDLRDAVAALVPVPVTVTLVDVGGRRLNRVRLGPVDDGAELARLRGMLLERGYAAGLALP